MRFWSHCLDPAGAQVRVGDLDLQKVLGGRAFEVISTPGGESLDSLTVWMPNERIAFTGNLFGPVFLAIPNLVTVRGDKPRLVQRYLSSLDTVRQQLLYEVHNPHAYFSPDVVLDMGTLNLDDKGNDSVRITGASGARRPDTLKVVAGYHDGWMGTGMIGFAWPEAYAKCEKSAEIIRTLVKERGWAVQETNVEYIGYNSLLGANADPTYRDQLNECFLRMTVRTRDKRVADGFGRLFPWLGLSGPPYVGSMKGILPAKELLGIWPAQVSRELVEKKVKIEMEKL